MSPLVFIKLHLVLCATFYFALLGFLPLSCSLYITCDVPSKAKPSPYLDLFFHIDHAKTSYLGLILKPS
jgi:hypothetical protein